jgi:peptidylprolyl isomerase
LAPLQLQNFPHTKIFTENFMKKFLSTFLTLIFAFMSQAHAQKNKTHDLENTLYIDLKYGRVVIEMLPQIAPAHVERIKTLARQKFYDGIVFHRVIDGFMAQTGDPTGTGMGGSKLPDLKAEFSDEPHVRGAVSMARAANPNSANSQFFIVTHDSRFLDNQYTVWGRVVKGMEFVDKVKKGAGKSGSVSDPDAMIKVRVAADVEKK